MSDHSYLFVPGDRPERFQKAIESGAHAVILDLEDAVVPAKKDDAREMVRAWLSSTDRPVYVRINPFDTIWHAKDCDLLKSPNLRGVMIPKSESPKNIGEIANFLKPTQNILPLIETVEGFFNVDAISKCNKVERLAFGSVDFMVDSGIQGDNAELDVIRTNLVLHSKRSGLLSPIDGVSLEINDSEIIKADVWRSKKWGFGAKLCIHPKQVGWVNSGFFPTQDEVSWASKVIEAIKKENVGVASVNGKLIDKPVIILAKRILDSVKNHNALTSN